MPDPADAKAELAALRAFSARIGSDPLLTQGAGGNTSLKDDGVLWIKASGTWLAHAQDRDIMVPVELEPLLAAVKAIDPVAEQAHRFTLVDKSPSGLRPSIETTVHALMPHRVVVHVHCVDTIAFAVRTDCERAVSDRLSGLNWTYVPYARPGLPLALAIAARSAGRPDILVLGNHGLVVAAETVEAAEALLDDVKRRLAVEPRRGSPPALAALGELAGDTGYGLPHSQAAHAAATDPDSLALAALGSLYPDHVIFLGTGSVVAEEGENVARVLARTGSAPSTVLFPGKGVLMRGNANPGMQAMAQCLADVLARIPPTAPVRVLTPQEHLQLTDWDAEKYRQELNRKAASGSAGAARVA